MDGGVLVGVGGLGVAVGAGPGCVGVLVGAGVEVACGGVVGVGVAPSEHPGMISCCPTQMKEGLARLLVMVRAHTVVPYWRAILESVSPAFTQ